MSYLRPTMCRQRLNKFVLISMEKELLNEIIYNNFWLLKYYVLLSIMKKIEVDYMQNLYFTLKMTDNERKNRFEWITPISIWKKMRERDDKVRERKCNKEVIRNLSSQKTKLQMREDSEIQNHQKREKLFLNMK